MLLQFRERDELVRIFKTWLQPQSSASVLMPKAWDYRVRQHLGGRYNCKGGCFDWDLAMKLHEKGVRMHVAVCFLCLWLFLFASIVLGMCSVVLLASRSMCDGGSGVWRTKCGRVPTK